MPTATAISISEPILVPAVLIVGSRSDPHVEAVADSLAASCAKRVVLDPWAAPVNKSALSLGFGGHAAGSVREGDVTIALSEIGAVWWRLKPPLGTPIDKLDSDARDFAIREWAHHLEYLDSATAGAEWVNARHRTRIWSNKPCQLAAAQAHRFSVPRTLVSNDAAEIEAFAADTQGPIIFKPLTWYADHEARVLYTNELTRQSLTEAAERLSVCPGIFQERVRKNHELRVTCVGPHVFATRIFSQREEGTELDWRRGQFEVPCEGVRDLSLDETVRAFHEKTGLVFGAYDFIVTPEDELVFLEVNPSGQWLWLEERTKQPITSAVAETLEENARKRGRAQTEQPRGT